MPERAPGTGAARAADPEHPSCSQAPGLGSRPINSSSPHADPAAYWRANLRLVLTLMAVWFAVSLGAGVLLREFLDQWTLPGTGFPLGFWFAQQGSILVFVVLFRMLFGRADADD